MELVIRMIRTDYRTKLGATCFEESDLIWLLYPSWLRNSISRICTILMYTQHTCVQSERSHSLGQSSFLQACCVTVLGMEQKVSGRSNKLPSARRCLQSVSRFWTPPPQVCEHCEKRETATFQHTCTIPLAAKITCELGQKSTLGQIENEKQKFQRPQSKLLLKMQNYFGKVKQLSLLIFRKTVSSF